MLSSLEMFMTVGAFVVTEAGATRHALLGQERAVRPGSENMCRWVWRFPRNLGDPVVSMEIPGRGYRVTNPRPVVLRLAAAGETKIAERAMVPPSEGNEVRRDGRQGVVVS